jgi:hypothetical protein
MTAVATRPVHPGLPEVRPHRTRGGRLGYVTVLREPDGVVRVLGWYDSRSDADRSLHPAHLGPATALRVVATLATAVRTRLVRPGLIR